MTRSVKRWTFRPDWWILGGLLASLAAVRAGRLEEADPYWQARAGMENLAGAPLARPDSWSWAPVEGLFFQTSPGWNDALGLGWLWGGFWGLFVVGLLGIGAYLGVMALAARLLGSRALPSVLGLLPVLALAMAMLSPRGTVVAQALLLAGLLLGWWWTERGRGLAFPANLLGVGLVAFAVCLAGNWLHLSWVLFSPLLVAGWGLLWLLGGWGWLRSGLSAAAAAVGGVGGVWLGPYGWSSVARLDSVRSTCEGLIAEWTSMLVPGLALRWAPAALLGVGIAFGALWLAWRRRRELLASPRLRLATVLALFGGPLAAGGVVAVRLIGIGLLLLAPVAAYEATLLADWFRARLAARSRPISARLQDWVSGRFWRVVLGAVLVVLSPGTLWLGAQHSVPRDLEALSHLPAGCRLYGLDGLGGSVAVLVRPDVTVWVDGRADYWGRERLRESLARLTDPNPADPLPPGATCVLLPDYHEGFSVAPVIAAVDADPGFERVGKWGITNVWVAVTLPEN